MNDQEFVQMAHALQRPLEAIRDIAVRERNKYLTGQKLKNDEEEALWAARADQLNDAISNLRTAANIYHDSPIVQSLLR